MWRVLDNMLCNHDLKVNVKIDEVVNKNMHNWYYRGAILFSIYYMYTYSSFAASFAACFVYHRATLIAIDAHSNTASCCSLPRKLRNIELSPSFSLAHVLVQYNRPAQLSHRVLVITWRVNQLTRKSLSQMQTLGYCGKYCPKYVIKVFTAYAYSDSYSKTGVKQPLKNRQNKDLNDKW